MSAFLIGGGIGLLLAIAWGVLMYRLLRRSDS